MSSTLEKFRIVVIYTTNYKTLKNNNHIWFTDATCMVGTFVQRMKNIMIRA